MVINPIDTFEFDNGGNMMGKAEQIQQGQKIARAGKMILLISLSAIALLVIACILFVAFWGGAFNFLFPKEVATYNSPDGEYSLVFEQMGDPVWPFGPTDVRLTLKNSNGKMINRVSTQIHDDGTCACEHNISSISWNNDAVVVILQGSEMQDKKVSLPYKKN